MIYIYLFGTCFHFICVFMIIAKKLWIQYKKTKEGQYICTKDTFYTSKY